MSQKLSREAYQALIQEDLRSLHVGPRTFERDHIITVLAESEIYHYDLPVLLQKILDEDDQRPIAGLSDALTDEICAWVSRLRGPRGG